MDTVPGFFIQLKPSLTPTTSSASPRSTGTRDRLSTPLLSRADPSYAHLPTSLLTSEENLRVYETDPAKVGDRQQIAEKMAIYQRACDRVDMALLETCFWKECHIEVGVSTQIVYCCTPFF